MLWPRPETSPISAPPRLPMPMPATLSLSLAERRSAPRTSVPGRMLNKATLPPALRRNVRPLIAEDLVVLILGRAYANLHEQFQKGKPLVQLQASMALN